MSATTTSGFHGAKPTIADLALKLSEGGRFDIHWTAIRGFADWVRRHPDELEEAVRRGPEPIGNPLDALLASFTEELCDTHGVDRPQWTAAVPPLEKKWEPPGTPRMLQQARRDTPKTFRVRNLTLARSVLFREARRSS